MPATENDFEAALAGARRGEETAWALLYDSFAPQVLGYLRARGAHDAEEVLGDVLLHVARGVHAFEGDVAKFRSWVFVIATSRLSDERRRRRRKPTEPLEPVLEDRLGAVADVEADVERMAAMAEVQDLLACLTPDQRTVVELRVFGELPSAEVAAIVDKPVGAVKALYHRGLGALRRELDCRGIHEALPVLDLPRPAVPRRVASAVTEGS